MAKVIDINDKRYKQVPFQVSGPAKSGVPSFSTKAGKKAPTATLPEPGDDLRQLHDASLLVALAHDSVLDMLRKDGDSHSLLEANKCLVELKAHLETRQAHLLPLADLPF